MTYCTADDVVMTLEIYDAITDTLIPSFPVMKFDSSTRTITVVTSENTDAGSYNLRMIGEIETTTSLGS